MVKRESDPLLGARGESFCRRLLSVPPAILPVALLSFGGPPAHLALAHDHFVYKKKWISDARFLEVLSIASAIPGPSSTQTIASMGLFRAGPLGGLVALVCWMLPSWIVMTAAGIGAKSYLQDGLPTWLSGLAPAAVSLVVIAAVRLWQKACGNDTARQLIAAASACVILATQGLSSLVFPITMAVGGIAILVANAFGWTRVEIPSGPIQLDRREPSHIEQNIGISPLVGGIVVIAWFVVLVLLAVYQPQSGDHTMLSMFYTFYWIGSIIFGGGQVMLPMLLNAIVLQGWVSKEQFLFGLALVQSLPGPLFNISAYLGAVLYGIPGALLASAGLFGPGIVLCFGLLPLWERVRDNRHLQIALAGVNASATGLIVASFFLLWEKAVHSNASAAVGLSTGLMVGVFRVPTPIAILLGAVLGFLLTPTVLDLGQQDFCTAP